MMFAIITPALITGAFANRVTFKAYMLFLTALAALRLLPVRAHDLGRRHPRRSGACSISPGGIVVHNTAGMAALASVLYVGRRQRRRTAARTASRWWRWAPACCGSAGTASTPAASSGSTAVTAVAFLNTDVAASFAAITWLVVGWWQREATEASSGC